MRKATNSSESLRACLAMAYDDCEWFTALRPMLSTISQPVEAFADQAWSMLMARLNNDRSPKLRGEVHCSLVIRESTVRNEAEQVGETRQLEITARKPPAEPDEGDKALGQSFLARLIDPRPRPWLNREGRADPPSAIPSDNLGIPPTSYESHRNTLRILDTTLGRGPAPFRCKSPQDRLRYS